MKLYCFGHSGHSYKVASFLNLSAVSWQPVFVDFFNGETRSEAYQKINAMGEVPALLDKGEILCQSGVILDYLVKETGKFKASNERENLRWILWDNHKGSSLFGTTRFLKNFLPKDKQNNDVIAFHEARVKNSIAVLERHLGQNDFLTGSEIATSDLSVSSYLFYPESFGWSRTETPFIDAWLTRIQNLPNWEHPYDLMPTDQSVINRTPAAKNWHK